MSSSKKLQSLQKQKEEFEEQIADLENSRIQCNQQIKGEGDLDKKRQLRSKMKNYSNEINQVYEDIDKIDEEINKLKLDNRNLSLNNHLDNPNNQRELKIDDSLCDIDFEKAIMTFTDVTSQFNRKGDAALFFMEESSIKRGDLFLKRLENHLKPKACYRDNFKYCPLTYTYNNEEAVTKGIASFFKIDKEVVNFDLIKEIGISLQRNSVLFIHIHCDINHESHVDPLIPWFIDKFWKPLINQVEEITNNQKYTGIKIVTVISSNLKIKERFLTESLSHYHNNDCSCFKSDKFVKIPLENWTPDDIQEWLSQYCHPSLTEDNIREKVHRIFNESLQGVPKLVCDSLQQQWDTLTSSPTSC